MLSDPIFQQLWERISRKTTYQLEFETDDVVAEAVTRINAMEPLEPSSSASPRTRSTSGAKASSPATAADRGDGRGRGRAQAPRRRRRAVRAASPLSRATIVRILKEIDNLDQVKVNPAVFIDQVADAINQALYDQVAEGIVYSPTGEIAGRPSCSRARTRTRRSPSPSSSCR